MRHTIYPEPPYADKLSAQDNANWSAGWRSFCKGDPEPDPSPTSQPHPKNP